MQYEIERKFLIDGFPPMAPVRTAEMEQGYLCHAPVVRIRKSVEGGAARYRLCFKGRGTLVRSELGLAFMPEPMVRGNLQRGRIVQLNLRETIPPRLVCLVYDRHRPLNTAAREFQLQLLNSAKREGKK